MGPTVTEHRPSVWIAANRLPVAWDARSGWQRAPGGLVTALESVVRSDHLGWIGAASALGTDDHRPPRWEHGPVVAVPVDADIVSGAVGAICNGALWPALHGLDRWVDWRSSRWTDYVEHNQAFADSIIEVTEPGDIVWVHDYHLLLVPRLVAQRARGRSIVLSIHTPVDASAVSRLPEAPALAAGIAHAGLVGVQTRADAHDLRLLLDRFGAAGNLPRVRVSPVSIDPEVMQRRASGEACRAIRQRLASAHEHRRLVVGIDRLDYTKGIPERLEAFDLAFRRGWLDPDEVDYVGIAQPSRTGVPAYRRLRLHTERLAHDIRARWVRTDGTSPIDVRFEGASPEHVAALLATADVCTVTPLRDGMNLVAKEYSAVCKDDGALLLSRGAGAFDEFGPWVVDVDGGDDTSVATGLRRAVSLAPETRRNWTASRRARLRTWTAAAWSADLLERRDADRPFGATEPGVNARP